MIENGAFENCANISVLDFSHNSIATFARKVFDETTYAAELRLSYNKLTTLNEVSVCPDSKAELGYISEISRICGEISGSVLSFSFFLLFMECFSFWLKHYLRIMLSALRQIIMSE